MNIAHIKAKSLPLIEKARIRTEPYGLWKVSMLIGLAVLVVGFLLGGGPVSFLGTVILLGGFAEWVWQGNRDAATKAEEKAQAERTEAEPADD